MTLALYASPFGHNGNAKQKVDPWPSLLFTQMRPPSLFIISEDMYKPSPRQGKVCCMSPLTL